MNCPVCGSVNTPGSPFCVHCGNILPQVPQNNQSPSQSQNAPTAPSGQHFSPAQNPVQQTAPTAAPAQPVYQPPRQETQPAYQPSQQIPNQQGYGPSGNYSPYGQEPSSAVANNGYVVNGVGYTSMNAAAEALRGSEPDDEPENGRAYPFGNQASPYPSSDKHERQAKRSSTWKPRKPISKKILVAGGVLVLLALIVVGAFALFGGNGYTEFDHVGMPLVNDGKIQIVAGKDVFSDTIDAEGISDGLYSLDGKVMALLTSEEELYVVKGKSVAKIADEVMDVEISTSGKGIAYITDGDDGYALNLYNVSKKESKKVTEEMASFSFAVSPDGKTVAYYVEGDDNNELMYFDGSESAKITSSETTLVGISNSGKYIYAICETDDEALLYSYDKKGERTKLGEIDDSSVRFNDDHTQVMFYCDGKTYISAKGKEGVKASSDEIRMVIPDSCNLFSDRTSATYPVSSLYDRVYIAYGDSSNSAWVIKKNADKSVKLASKVSSASMDENGKYLYYVHDYEELKVLKISDGDKASDKAVELCDDLENYIVTPNRSKVYYISDGCLYSVNGKKGGNPTEIAEDVDEYSLAVSKKNVAYYIVDGELYACSNGKSGERVLDECETVYNTPNGTVYASNEDTLYGTTGSKKLEKIAEIE